jgi:hypothetical protein
MMNRSLRGGAFTCLLLPCIAAVGLPAIARSQVLPGDATWLRLGTAGTGRASVGAGGRVPTGTGGPFAGCNQGSLAFAGPIGGTAWEASGALDTEFNHLLSSGTRVRLRLETSSRAVSGPVRGTVAGLEDWLPLQAAVRERLESLDLLDDFLSRGLFDPSVAGLAEQGHGRVRRVSALRITPTLQREAGALRGYLGATWAGGRSQGTGESAPGVVWGVRTTRGPISLSWDGRSGRGTRSTVGIDYTAPADTTTMLFSLPRSIVTRTNHTYWDSGVRLAVTRRAWQATGHLGYRLGREGFGSRRFGGVEAAWGVMENLSLFALSRYELSSPEQRLPGRRVAQIGLSLGGVPRAGSPHTGSPRTVAAPSSAVRDTRPHQAASEFRVLSVGGASGEIACRIPAATKSVLASGDFTDWAPRPMVAGPGGWWRLALPLEPGPHRISVAVDGGAWAAPPGIPCTGDGFGGTVGLFVVP